MVIRQRKPDISFDITYGRNGECKIWIDGTDEWRDLKVSLKGFMPWWGIHRGVEQAALEIYDMLEQSDTLKYDQTYYLGGHSMGGALAVGVADLLWNKAYNVKKVITYGAYGTGIDLQAKAEHYRNKGDLIPFIFPWWKVKSHRITCPKEAKWPKRFINAHKYYDKELWGKI